jgi:hypothetical protein
MQRGSASRLVFQAGWSDIGGAMRQKFQGTNITVFLLFFGLSLLEAFGSRNWIVAALWLVVGILFLHPDLVRRSRLS